MATERELAILSHIAVTYGELIAEAAAVHSHRPEVLAGIMCRESEGGLSKLLDKPGPEGRGDGGNGLGLMQLDRRWHPEFYASGDWRNPAKNIMKGALELAAKRRVIARLSKKLGVEVTHPERAAVASYNCGEGRVMQALRLGLGEDYYSAHRNYSSEVLRFAAAYALLDGRG
jgi:hypothetical protein